MESEPNPTPPSNFLFSVDTLLTEQELCIQKENTDRALAQSIEQPNVVELGDKLKQWALAGFPNIFPVLYFSFNYPSICSDGITRSFADYFQYLVGCTLEEQIQKLESKLKGIKVQCEYTAPSSFTLRVTKS